MVKNAYYTQPSIVQCLPREAIMEEKQLICRNCLVGGEGGGGSDQFRIFWGDFVIYMEILEIIFLVLKYMKKCYGKLPYLKRMKELRFGCIIHLAFPHCLARRRKNYPNVVCSVMGGGVRAHTDNVHR